MEATPLSLQEIREICDRALNGLRDEIGDQVALHVDHYWSIPRNALYDVYSEPSELTVGQVVDELENLRRTLAQDDGAVPPQALRWLGAVLTAIGDELTP